MSTNFIGSVAIMKTADPKTTAAVIEASGTAIFTGNIDVAGPINASASAVYTQPIGNGPSNQRGILTAVQQVTIIHTNTAANPVVVSMPSGSNIIDFMIDVEEPFDTAAGATAGNVEFSAAGGATLAVVPVSASARYQLVDANANNVSNLRNVTATVEAWVSIQGSGTTLSVGQALLSVVYRPAGV